MSAASRARVDDHHQQVAAIVHSRERVSAAGVLLAAGGGRRFGGPKALATLDGQLLVERGVELLRTGGLDPVVVVLGAEAGSVRRAADLGGAVLVDNPDWPSGMGSSLRAGLGAAVTAPAAVVALVDQPLVGPGAVERLLEAWRLGALVAVATYEGRHGHPVLFDAQVWPGVMGAAVGDEGARGFLRDNADLVVTVGCDGTGSPDDVDTRSELAALSARR